MAAHFAAEGMRRSSPSEEQKWRSRNSTGFIIIFIMMKLAIHIAIYSYREHEVIIPTKTIPIISIIF